MRSDVHRAGEKASQRRTIVVYVLAGLAAGVLAGALLGWFGSILPVEARGVLATVFAIGAIVIGGIELSGRRVPLVQLNRETPIEWVDTGPIRWAVQNGIAIGFGGGNRVGFWLWYVIPLGAFLSGSSLIGAAGYALYSLVRTLSAGGMLFLFEREKIDREGRWILDMFDSAHAIAAVQLLVMGVITLGLVGALG